ncbi:MAG: SPFH domain-containing protein [Gammaproteobacteria bacterium]|nr:SPFH domain-containing protein [Gammaproteobacteria bacterium]NNM14337.1 SPFH domain-containing protein [Gammaproteobacteria bacterium]
MNVTNEFIKKAVNGWLALPVAILVGLALAYWMKTAIGYGGPEYVLPVIFSIVIFVVCLGGFFTLQPNMSAVMTLFGKYKGTVKTEGFSYVNPLYKKKKVSLRANNLNGEIIKVNDNRGNPIEIATVVVWKVVDTARAIFDVDDYNAFVRIQSEAALRQLAMDYSYDTFDSDDEQSLRSDTEAVTEALTKVLQERIDDAGVKVIEARISHLAYAQEIASAMLQRQQADAIVAARIRIVDGAVGMVEMALKRLEDDGLINLDEERKASMVSNLLVVLCGDKAAQPVLNTGSLYS